MQITEHGLKKPASDDFYNVEDFNDNTQILEEHLKDTDTHVNASEIAGIDEADQLSQIDSEDTNSIMWGKVKKAISTLISHISTVATASNLGHIKIGTGLQMSSGVASVNLSDLVDKIYPIGSIYMSVNSVSPASFIGGTWERYANGRTLIGVDENDSTFSASGNNGGSKTNTLTTTNMPSHAHSFSGTSKPAGSASTSITVNSVGNHYHNSGALGASQVDIQGYIGDIGIDSNSGLAVGGVFTGGVSNTNRGSIGVSNVTDYAYLNASHSHSVTGTTDLGGAHSHSASASTSLNMNNLTISGTTGSNGSGTAVNNLQPYTTVYMWKRTA